MIFLEHILDIFFISYALKLLRFICKTSECSECIPDSVLSRLLVFEMLSYRQVQVVTVSIFGPERSSASVAYRLFVGQEILDIQY